MLKKLCAIFSIEGTPDAPPQGQGLILPLLLSVLCLLTLALILVWLNIERTKLAYQHRTLIREEKSISDLHAKLEVEREHLLSPHELGRKAEKMGLYTAKPGQIRRMGEARHVPGRQSLALTVENEALTASPVASLYGALSRSLATARDAASAFSEGGR